mmetsp:Transcript_5289/g.15390  ORF Transcript_5289/g.15390 Transcript_5289/m.15390 type:complete len:80 (+) Transcript_5289:31-270(+)
MNPEPRAAICYLLSHIAHRTSHYKSTELGEINSSYYRGRTQSQSHKEEQKPKDSEVRRRATKQSIKSSSFEPGDIPTVF